MRRFSNFVIISLFAVLTIITGCMGGKGNGNGTVTEADSIYTWEYIRKYIFEEPEHAFALVDTAETLGAADANFANWMRAQIHLAKDTKADIDKARDYCMKVLDSQNPVADSLQRVKTYQLLLIINKINPETYQDAIRYAIEGAKISHENGWTGEEAMFYFTAGETMEKIQAGSGNDYMDRSLDLFRKSHNLQALPILSSYLGNAARIAIEHEDYARAEQLMEERVQVINCLEKEYTTVPIGYIDKERAYVYSLLALCQYQLGDKVAARSSAQAFEKTKSSQLPEHQKDILIYYIFSGDAQNINRICAALEPYYQENKDTISTEYTNFLMNYASGLEKMGRSHEAYSQLLRYTVLADSLVQRERRSDTQKYAQQMKTQEKELLLKEEEAKTRIQRVMLLSAAVIILLIGYLLVRSHLYNNVLEAKNLSLYKQIQKREEEEARQMQQLQAEPEEQLTPNLQLYRRLCQLMEDEKLYTDETLNREVLAAKLGTNYKYVEQTIRECANGETVFDFINRYRLQYVANLLRTTDETVSLISEMSGIGSRSTFFRLFRDFYGMSPTEFRKTAREKDKHA